jgi:hypothetical protein
LVAVGVVAVTVLALGRAPVQAPLPRLSHPGPPAPPVPGAVAPSRSVDPEGIRDVFRFAGEPAPAEPHEFRPVASGMGASGPSPPPSGPRLVGLVSRGGHLAAALATEGDVVLAAAGESAAGVTVLAVGEEGVRIRHRDGREEFLPLP